MVRSLYSIITDLKNPNVRLEDNSLYCIDNNGIGILYASSINKVQLGDSLGLMLQKIPDLNPEVIKHFKKKNQIYNRISLEKNLGSLKTRRLNAEELIIENLSSINNNKIFFTESVEYLISKLSEQDFYERIGSVITDVAKTFHNLAQSRKMQNINFSKEYDSIYRNLKDE